MVECPHCDTTDQVCATRSRFRRLIWQILFRHCFRCCSVSQFPFRLCFAWLTTWSPSWPSHTQSVVPVTGNIVHSGDSVLVPSRVRRRAAGLEPPLNAGRRRKSFGAKKKPFDEFAKRLEIQFSRDDCRSFEPWTTVRDTYATSIFSPRPWYLSELAAIADEVDNPFFAHSWCSRRSNQTAVFKVSSASRAGLWLDEGQGKRQKSRLRPTDARPDP